MPPVSGPYLLNFNLLKQTVETCRLCPRLVKHRETVPSLPVYREQPHWRRPIMGYGDLDAWLLILGLAPSPQGANRTGRVFTGDQTARFLIRMLYAEGFANQETSLSKDDGLEFRGCYVTASVKCVPPAHKPLPIEFTRCLPYFENEFFLLKKLKATLVLGKAAFDTYLRFLRSTGTLSSPLPKFAHGSKYTFGGWPTLFSSYHPTPQNTNTGKLTETMFLEVLRTIKKEAHA
jgi:uracil-DNA glycosylase family 4